MIRIGVLGTIGSGKSFISKLFRCPIFDADKEVASIYRTDKRCFNLLKKKLPKFIKTFPVKKSELINSIKADEKNLKKISLIVHPLVRKKMRDFLNKNKYQKIIILDIPLLIENKLNKKGDVLILIKSSKKKIIKRLRKRVNFNEKVFRKLKENQVLISKKKKFADYVVDNNYSIKIMKKKINLLKSKILNERNST